MIIGNGSLAKLLKDREGAIFFCSGVTHNVTPDACMREANLLATFRNDERCLFYFGSIASSFTVSPYHNHKIAIQRYIKSVFNNYNIIKLGNIWECTNKNTFRNYLKAHPEKKVYDEYKYMISSDQLNMICQSLPLTGQNEISIFSEMLKVKECLKR